MRVGIIDLEAIVQQAVDRATDRVVGRLEELVSRAAESGDLLDIEQAAAVLKTTPAALYRRVSRGTIAVVRNGGRVRFRRSDLTRAR